MFFFYDHLILVFGLLSLSFSRHFVVDLGPLLWCVFFAHGKFVQAEPVCTSSFFFFLVFQASLFLSFAHVGGVLVLGHVTFFFFFGL